MITFIHNKCLKYKLNPLILTKNYLLEATPTLCVNINATNKQFFNTKLLLYNIINFYIWISFILFQHLCLLIVVPYKDINFLKQLFNTYMFSIIAEKAWLPGILSNNNEIKCGNRYLSLVKNNAIQLQTYPNFIFLCDIKRSLISMETNKQLIPQFATILSISNTMSNYFIPLFVPKFKILKKKEKFYQIKNKLYKQMNITSYFIQKRRTLEIYLHKSKILNRKGYLIYFLFLNTLRSTIYI